MNNILNLKSDIDDKNFVDKLYDFLEGVKRGDKKTGFMLWFDDETFLFDWFGDTFRLIGGIDYAKCVISSHIIEELRNDDE